ncbi:MAG: helix-turn-helix domain-containing protein [Enterococcus sp.]
MLKSYIKRILELMFLIIRKDSTSLKELSEELQTSKRTIKEDIIRLNRLINEQFSIKEFIVSNRSGVITINPLYQKDALKYSYAFKLAILKSSVSFNYCVLLTTHATITKDELLNSLYISDSYLSKQTHQLNTFFTQFGIRIASTHEQYFLTGDELAIRLFSYIFLQDSFQSMEWPFKETSMEEIHQLIPAEIYSTSSQRSNTKKSSLYILYAILQLRIRSGNFIQWNNMCEFSPLLELIQENYDVGTIFYQNGFGAIPKEHLSAELLSFNILSRIFISDIISTNRKIDLGNIFLTTNHPLCSLSKAVYNKIYTLDPRVSSPEKKALYTYYFTIFMLFHNFVGHTMDAFLQLFIPVPIYHHHAKKNDSQMLQIHFELAQLLSDKSQTVLMSSLVYALADSEKQPKINIYLQMTKNFAAVYFVKNRIQALFNSNNILIVSDYAKADLVITDTLELSDRKKEIFYLDSISNEERWDVLLHLIQRKASQAIRNL